MSTNEDSSPSSPTRFGLKRSTAMEFDHISDTTTLATLKSEDSGIVLANGMQSPDEETKDIVGSNQDAASSKPAAGERGGRRRRSSTETYSSAEEDVDENRASVEGKKRNRDSGINGVWVSDDENANDAHGNQHGVAMDTEPDQLSVGGSPVKDEDMDSPAPEPEVQEPVKEERPKVDFKRGITCTDVIHALEILMTCYRLPDVNPREHHKRRSIWGTSDYSSRSSYMRVHHGNDARLGGSAKLTEISQAIERRHIDIVGIFTKLMELEAANRAEAEALVRLTGITKGTEGGLSSPELGPGHAAEAVNPRLAGKDGTNAASTSPVQSRKRRNPFTRAVHAIRKRFARPQSTVDQPVPVAA